MTQEQLLNDLHQHYQFTARKPEEYKMKWPPYRPIIIGALIICLVVLIVGKARAQDLKDYTLLSLGYCEDVQRPCAKLIKKDTPYYYAVIEDGKLIAITKAEKGKEVTVWGKLPPKQGEHDL